MENNNSLLFLKESLKNLKFRNQNKSWYLSNDFASAVLEYQKSRYSDNFYLNIGIIFKDKIDKPKKYYKVDDCHLTSSYERIYDDHIVANLEDHIFKDSKLLNNSLSGMMKKIEGNLIPLLKEYTDKEFMKENYFSFPNEKWWLQNIYKDEFYQIFESS